MTWDAVEMVVETVMAEREYVVIVVPLIELVVVQFEFVQLICPVPQWDSSKPSPLPAM